MLCGHYTSAASAIGILKGKSVWATNIKFLNDKKEFDEAFGLVESLLVSPNIKNSDPHYERFSEFLNGLKEIAEGLLKFYSESVFIVSFSEDFDLLSQWRGYCPKGSGYCLVFDDTSLLDRSSLSERNVRFVKCVYKDSEKRAKLRELLNEYWEKYRSAVNKTGRQSSLRTLELELKFCAAHFKHASFQEEKEHRLIFLRVNENLEVKFRDNGRFITPYVEIPINSHAIRQIWIGPTTEPDVSELGVRSFTSTILSEAERLFGDLAIKHSSIPYR